MFVYLYILISDFSKLSISDICISLQYFSGTDLDVFMPFALPGSMVCLSYFHLFYIFFSLFPLMPWQLRVTVWSLCTKAVSYIKYPKACQKSEYENNIGLFVFLWLMSVYVLPRVPEDRPSGLGASACPMNHIPFFTLWHDPGYVAKLWSSLLTAVPLFSKWGMLLITGLSAAWGKNDCLWLSPFSACNTMPSCVPSQLSYK